MVLSSGSMVVAGPQLASQLALAAAFNQKCWPTTHITHLHNFLPYLTISSILQYSINNADQYDSYYPPRQSNFEALRVFPPYQSCITWQSYNYGRCQNGGLCSAICQQRLTGRGGHDIMWATIGNYCQLPIGYYKHHIIHELERFFFFMKANTGCFS